MYRVYKKGFESKKIELFRRGETCQRMIRSKSETHTTTRAKEIGARTASMHANGSKPCIRCRINELSADNLSL